MGEKPIVTQQEGLLRRSFGSDIPDTPTQHSHMYPTKYTLVSAHLFRHNAIFSHYTYHPVIVGLPKNTPNLQSQGVNIVVLLHKELDNKKFTCSQIRSS
jgi:hypothetical protein